MKDLKHTPGPWEYQDHKIVSLSSWFVEPNEDYDDPGIRTTVINTIGAMGGNDIEADAKLIAAAPELLEALKAANEFIGKIAMYSEDSVPPIELVKQIDKTIRKATT